ncbi:MAG: LytTR family transcriptional regulator DNA-binding domain-containing protein [Bacteroidaceae bacterium]|nr:LytTR family transcriptional regulator DNA-binding domain-containing protein [Bacteroidaceae bacterium]MBQ8675740.1 LytTR family transcriptional regulator DNA-binding domain-containing protein [Bacteroidaceae bacterium]MBQ9175666.1 LytTR family transcriptional regulator DNA-binding domain-containing protein [Bacteroidaceae bacterium]MBR1378062.1 LytTR family transcriptional regulator DNA-binding domain-containing protein [Bacteroidaceae bacterium]
MTTEYLYLNSRDELLRLDISQIVYFQADGNYTNIILANKLKCVVCMNLSQMQNMLSAQLKEKASNFARIGKSYIINMNYICAIQILKQSLILSDQRTFAFSLAISKEALKTLRSILIKK